MDAHHPNPVANDIGVMVSGGAREGEVVQRGVPCVWVDPRTVTPAAVGMATGPCRADRVGDQTSLRPAAAPPPASRHARRGSPPPAVARLTATPPSNHSNSHTQLPPP